MVLGVGRTHWDSTGRGWGCWTLVALLHMGWLTREGKWAHLVFRSHMNLTLLGADHLCCREVCRRWSSVCAGARGNFPNATHGPWGARRATSGRPPWEDTALTHCSPCLSCPDPWAAKDHGSPYVSATCVSSPSLACSTALWYSPVVFIRLFCVPPQRLLGSSDLLFMLVSHVFHLNERVAKGSNFCLIVNTDILFIYLFFFLKWGSYLFIFLPLDVFILKYSWCTILYKLQVYSIVIHNF